MKGRLSAYQVTCWVPRVSLKGFMGGSPEAGYLLSLSVTTNDPTGILASRPMHSKKVPL